MASPAVSVSKGFSWSKNMNPSDLSRFEFNLTVYKHFSQGYPILINGLPLRKVLINGQIELGATQIAWIHVFRSKNPLGTEIAGLALGYGGFQFSLQCTNFFPESGSGKHFQDSGMHSRFPA